MINKLRKFSTTRAAQVIVVIIIIPFVFWGMGGVFSGGNTNNIVKINNHNITTQDFMDHLNNSNLNPEKLKENIDNGILEEFLNELISNTLLYPVRSAKAAGPGCGKFMRLGEQFEQLWEWDGRRRIRASVVPQHDLCIAAAA